jgi:hypothetical protein
MQFLLNLLIRHLKTINFNKSRVLHYAGNSYNYFSLRIYNFLYFEY